MNCCDFVKRHADVVLLMILDEGECSILPELRKVFGSDKLFAFIELFSGMTINIPTRERMIQIYRDVHVWSSLRGSRLSVDDLASQYGLERSSIKAIYKRVDTMVRKSKRMMVMMNKELKTPSMVGGSHKNLMGDSKGKAS